MTQQGMMKIFMVIALAVAALSTTGAHAGDFLQGACIDKTSVETETACIREHVQLGDTADMANLALGRAVRIVTMTVEEGAEDGSTPGYYELHRFDLPNAHYVAAYRDGVLVAIDRFPLGTMRR